MEIATPTEESAGIEQERRRRESLSRAKSFADQGHWELATPLYREVLADITDDADALRGLGLAALHAERHAEAVNWLLRAHFSAPYSVPILTELGLAQKRCGLAVDALASYRRALMLDEGNAVLLVNVGRAEREAGRLPSAILSFQRALAVDPESAEIWSMLSNVLREASRVPEALEAARKAVQLNPRLPEVHLNEGAALHAAGQLGDAAVSYFVASLSPRLRPAAIANLQGVARQLGKRAGAYPAVRLVARLLDAPGDAAGLRQLASLVRSERPPVALVCLEQSLRVAPSAAAERELSTLLWEQGQVRLALEHLLRAIATDRGDLLAYRQLGEWLSVPNKISLHSPAWQRLFAECPDDAPSLMNLGVALRRRGFPMQAAELQERALALAPESVPALVNLGAALSSQAAIEAAIGVYRRALAIDPGHREAASNLLFSLHLDPSQSPESILDEHCRIALGLRPCMPALGRTRAAPLDAGRRLRIGYVSPDFRSHPVALFLEPVLRAHDRQSVEVFCYSDVAHPDAVTARLARGAEHFVACAGWSDTALFERIRADGIDILVDLAGHTAGNRLAVFAGRPCPVQASWLGYFDTTGLPAVDFRIADAASVPPSAERYFVERVLRLPRSANCFLPPDGPEPSEPPRLGRGHVTFGCFNNPAKINRRSVAAFARVLGAVPGSELMLKYLAFNEPAMCERYRSWFAAEGIAPERILFEGPSSLERFHESFSRIDIALDPFPYSGETTALHTLWMGVPLVALEGPTLAQRLASRVLRIAGLDEWVARDEHDYLRIARDLAQSEPVPGARRALRTRLRASPLLDHAGVTRDLEAAYHAMWRDACERPR